MPETLAARKLTGLIRDQAGPWRAWQADRLWGRAGRRVSVASAAGRGRRSGTDTSAASCTADGYAEIAAPTYPPRPQGEAPQVDMFGRTVPDTLQYVWALEAADPEDGDAA